MRKLRSYEPNDVPPGEAARPASERATEADEQEPTHVATSSGVRRGASLSGAPAGAVRLAGVIGRPRDGGFGGLHRPRVSSMRLHGAGLARNEAEVLPERAWVHTHSRYRPTMDELGSGPSFARAIILGAYPCQR